MYRYIKFKKIFIKQFEEPLVKEYSTKVAVIFNAANEEFQNLLNLNSESLEITQEEFFDLIKNSDQYKYELNKLHNLVTKRLRDTEAYILGRNGQSESYIQTQKEIYTMKESIARGDFNGYGLEIITAEALEYGMTIEEYKELILQKALVFREGGAKLALLANTFRSIGEEKLARGEDIEEFLRAGELMGADTILEDILALA